MLTLVDTNAFPVSAEFFAAARELTRHDFDVTLLEARDRLGGRTWTDIRWGKNLDMGAVDLKLTRLGRLYGKELPPWNVTAAFGRYIVPVKLRLLVPPNVIALELWS